MARSIRETTKTHNVFLSWSGERSLYVAQFFHGWLQKVLQQAKPWLSERDIEKGTVGVDEIKKVLTGMKVGIFFLTPENRESVWMSYEAGSLANEVDDKSRICTYFLGGLQLPHVKGPLGIFQRTKPDKDDTLKLVRSINKAIGGVVSDAHMDEIFEKWWPDLEDHLQHMPEAEGTPKALPSNDQMLSELLEFARAAANSRKQSEWLEELTADFKDFFPQFFQSLKGVNINQLLTAPAPPPPPPPREPRSTFCIKLVGIPEIKRIEGTVAAVTAKGEVAVVVGNEVVARFESVEGWWKETPETPEATPKTITGDSALSAGDKSGGKAGGNYNMP
jgi:hypothetical protein